LFTNERLQHKIEHSFDNETGEYLHKYNIISYMHFWHNYGKIDCQISLIFFRIFPRYEKLPSISMKIFQILIILILLATSLKAQNKEYYTSRTDIPLTIDGVMDEVAWDLVPWGNGFVQSQPYDGKEPSQPTFFRILFDDDNLYIGILAYDSVPEQIERRMTRRDGFEGDRVTVCIDSYYDKRTAFSFTITAAGVKGDEYVTEDGDSWDANWDPIWYAKTSLHASGWTAEIQIPYSQIRFGDQEEYVWGMEIVRILFRKDEWSQWKHIPQDASGWVNHFGELKGVRGIKPKRQVDLIPYVVADMETFEKEEGNPYRDKGFDPGISAGLDGKIGLTNDLTLDFTVNPDFGQVEADPSEVNLTAFETFFPEKRPFFVEKKDIISLQLTGGQNSFSRENLFYSRRIGRQPRFAPDLKEDEYMNIPENTTILGAFKVTGKTKDGWSVGFLESLTQREMAEISSNGETRTEEVEPLTNYLSGRILKDIKKGNTILGAMLTATHRDIKNPSIDFMPAAAYSGGLNFTQYFQEKKYMLRVKGVFSQLKGDTMAITNIQRSPVHYYQRPDADYLKLDSSRTTLAGHGGTVEFAKFGQGHLNFWAWVTWRSPGLDMNDIGYERSGDVIFQVFWAGYRIWEPFSIFRRMNINFNQWTGWDFGGRSSFSGLNMNVNTQLKNYWFFGTGFNHDFEGLDNFGLRGGPSLKYPGSSNYWISIGSDERKKLIIAADHSRAWSPESGDVWQDYSLDVSYRPWNALKLTLSPFLSLRTSDIQYVTTDQFMDQDRYVVSAIDQTTFGLVARVDYNITPDLTIQYYGQPFISSGDYKEFKYITDPVAEEYDDRFHIYCPGEISYDENEEIYFVDENSDGQMDYTIENPNFNFMQYRSNLVIRWEYIPGSAIYLVWSQDRTDMNNLGEFDFGNDMNSLFSVTPNNVFLIKISYRIKL
jgi:hypothetical protein